MAIIYTYPTKAAPTADDLVLISDAADSNKTKNAKISSIQSLVSGVNSVNGLAGAVLLDSTTGVSGNNLTITTTPGTNTISYKLNDNLNDITDYEEGIFTPTLEYYDKSSTTWIEWTKNPDGTVNSNRVYNQQIGNYVKTNKNVSLSLRCYVQNNDTSAFDCGGVRLSLPFNLNSASSLAVGFTQSSGNASTNSTSMSRAWTGQSYVYMLREEAIAGTDTDVFGNPPVPQIYFQSFSTSLTYRLRIGQTTFNMSGSGITL
tara:strand:- start:886 stop:1665 length:780 start_codon:yes stop_codon:yes gene_type:complete